jgi:hypothetical protein
MLQTHLMCLPFLASIVLHFLWQYRSWARKHVAQCLAIVAIGFAACLPYLLSLARPVAGTPLSAPSRSATSWLFPLMGGRFFSSIGLDYFFGKNWQNSSGLPALLWLLTWVSALGLITFWIGLAEAWRFLAKNLRSPGERPVEFHLWSVVCLTLLLQIVMSGVADTGNHPHYYNGTSFCAFTLVWLAYSEVKNRRWRWIGAGLHAASLLAILLMTVGRIHQTQGNTSIHYGPTLGTQLEILRELDFQNPQTVVFNETSHYSSFPEAFSELQILYPLHFSPSAPVRRLVIRYADPQSGAGRLAVAEASPETTDKQMMRLR